MAAHMEMCYEIDINAPLLMQDAITMMVEGDNKANTLVVKVMDGQTSADLTGWAATAYMIRSDGYRPFVTGTVTGNTVKACLSDTFYATPGRYNLFVRLTHTDGTKRTILWLNGWVNTEAAQGTIDADDVIPTLDELLAQIEAMETATTKAEAAAKLANEAAAYLPEATSPYQVLTTDADNNPVWVERLAYESAAVEILPETELVKQSANNFLLVPAISEILVPDELYTVTYNGTEYACKAIAVETGSPGGNFALGNVAAAMGTGDTGEPFALLTSAIGAMASDYYALVFTVEDVDAATLSIAKGGIKKIDQKFLGVFSLLIERETEDGVSFTYKPSHSSAEVYKGVTNGTLTGAWFSNIDEETSSLPMFTPIKILNVTDSGAVLIDENTQKVFTLIDGTFSEVSST